MLVLSFGLTLTLNVLVTFLHVMAIGLTLFRLYYRNRIHRLWWDDYTAGFAILIDFGYLPLMWVPYTPHDSVLHSNASVVAQYWLSNTLFFTAIWLTRISIALAIARIFPPGDIIRRFAIGLALLFVALSTAITSHFSVICSRQSAVKNLSAGVICFWTTDLRIIITIANFVSDGLLVATPLYKLWHVRLPRKQRRLILAGFAASALTSTATIGCAVFQFAPASWDPARQYLRFLLRYFEAAISFTACNLLVVITYVHTVLRARDGEHEELTRSPPPETTQMTHNTQPINNSHSNQVPSESALSTLILTQITDANVYTNTNNLQTSQLLRETRSANYSSYSSHSSPIQ